MLDETESDLNNIFVVPYEKKIILYAPLKKKLVLINKEGLVLLKKFIKNKNIEIPAPLRNFLESKDVLEVDTKSPLPYKLNLLLTTDCNLLCKYCYSEGGKNKIYMTWEVAKAAIDFITQRVLEEKKNELTIYFQGGGEPTLNWEVLVKSVKYGKEIAKKYGWHTKFRITTNGVLSGERAVWLANNLEFITVSFDGPKDIQNYNRPFPDGKGSFDIALKSVHVWDKMGFKYDIHSTIPKIFVSRMSDCVKFFAKNTKAETVGFFETERSGYALLRDDMHPPTEEDFVNNFLKAKKVGEERNLNVYCAKTNPLYFLTHLRGSEKVFTVTANGFVTTINEVDDITKPGAKKYIYGKYEKGKFDIYWDRLHALDNILKKNIEFCKKCFCLYNCFLKEMKFKEFESKEQFMKANAKKCWYIRKIMKNELVKLVKNEVR